MSEYPNTAGWLAMQDGQQVNAHKRVWITSVVEVEKLELPSGKLVIYDPSSLDSRYSYQFYPNGSKDDSYYFVPIGQHRIFVTLATSENDSRNAYSTMILRPDETEVKRVAAIPVTIGKMPVAPLKAGNFYGVGVDAGMICFVDEINLLKFMPQNHDQWFDVYHDVWLETISPYPAPTKSKTFWNLVLPNAKTENMIVTESGFGDGWYPIIWGLNSKDEVIAIHVDFGIFR